MYSREFRQVASSLIVLGFSSKIGTESKTPKDKYPLLAAATGVSPSKG
jgi:hypothetical protein